jgi:hypothetical protein
MGSNPARAAHEGRKTTKSTDGTPEELNSKGYRDPVEMRGKISLTGEEAERCTVEALIAEPTSLAAESTAGGLVPNPRLGA